jgi:hypothetical protein
VIQSPQIISGATLTRHNIIHIDRLLVAEMKVDLRNIQQKWVCIFDETNLQLFSVFLLYLIPQFRLNVSETCKLLRIRGFVICK